MIVSAAAYVRHLRCHRQMSVNGKSKISDNGGCVNELATDVDAAKRKPPCVRELACGPLVGK